MVDLFCFSAHGRSLSQALDAQQLADWEKPVDALAEERGMYLLDLLWGALSLSR